MVFNPVDAVIWLVVAALAYLVLRAQLWRAVLCLRPGSIELGEDAPADAPLPAALTATHEALTAEGFKRLGSHYERPKLRGALVSHDYAQAEAGVYATVYLSHDGQPRLYFLSQTRDDTWVMTANFHRPAHEVPGKYSSGSLENLPIERVFKAHARRVAASGEPKPTGGLEERVQLARAWFEGPGQWEVRQQNALGLLWTLGTVGVVAAVILARR